MRLVFFVYLFYLWERGHPGKWWLKHASVLCREIMLSCVQLYRREGEVLYQKEDRSSFLWNPCLKVDNAFHRLDYSFSKPGWEVYCGTWGKSRASLSSRICSWTNPATYFPFGGVIELQFSWENAREKSREPWGGQSISRQAHQLHSLRSGWRLLFTSSSKGGFLLPGWVWMSSWGWRSGVRDGAMSPFPIWPWVLTRENLALRYLEPALLPPTKKPQTILKNVIISLELEEVGEVV